MNLGIWSHGPPKRRAFFDAVAGLAHASQVHRPTRQKLARHARRTREYANTFLRCVSSSCAYADSTAPLCKAAAMVVALARTLRQCVQACRTRKQKSRRAQPLLQTAAAPSYQHNYRRGFYRSGRWLADLVCVPFACAGCLLSTHSNHSVSPNNREACQK